MKATDFVYDIQRGICRVVVPEQKQSSDKAEVDHSNVEDVDHIEAIEASIACLSEVIQPANQDIGPIEQFTSNGKMVNA